MKTLRFTLAAAVLAASLAACSGSPTAAGRAPAGRAAEQSDSTTAAPTSTGLSVPSDTTPPGKTGSIAGSGG